MSDFKAQGEYEGRFWPPGMWQHAWTTPGSLNKTFQCHREGKTVFKNENHAGT